MRPEHDSPAIQIERLTKAYGRVQALKGVSLLVGRGEIFGLLGANGAGKTTLIKILVGITRRDGGSVSVLGIDPLERTYELRRHLGYMPQAPALYEDLTARDNIRFFARARRLDRLEERIDNVLAFTDLVARQHDPVYGFSGGMKQRVSLACALVHQPRLLLLDEPTAGIDPKLREAFWAHFRTLAADGVTLLVSTHQMDEALHCDRVAVMRDGSVLACDTPRGLLAHGKTQVTIWRSGQPHTETLQDYPAQLPRLLGASADIERVEIRENTLEDVVLGLIHEEAGGNG